MKIIKDPIDLPTSYLETDHQTETFTYETFKTYKTFLIVFLKIVVY